VPLSGIRHRFHDNIIRNTPCGTAVIDYVYPEGGHDISRNVLSNIRSQSVFWYKNASRLYGRIGDTQIHRNSLCGVSTDIRERHASSRSMPPGFRISGNSGLPAPNASQSACDAEEQRILSEMRRLPGAGSCGAPPSPGPVPTPSPSPNPPPAPQTPLPAPGGDLSVVSMRASATAGGTSTAATRDGNPATRWSARGAGQRIGFYLGNTPATVDRIGIAWYRGDTRKASFAILVSTDGKTWQQVYRGAGSGNSTGLETYTFPATQARYVRIVGYGNTENDWNSITEVKMYGR
jgi:hypothetical protein